jgi:pyridoxine kinase
MMRVLSIQSTVTHGYVGNKCAVFTLNAMGYEVDAIDTVHFSNHTGYPVWKGDVATGEQILSIFDGLRENKLLANYTHLLTGANTLHIDWHVHIALSVGYMRSASCVDAIGAILQALREVNPKLVFVCDPVMGDDGKLYIPEENVPRFRSLTPKADFLLPNQTEAQ